MLVSIVNKFKIKLGNMWLFFHFLRSLLILLSRRLQKVRSREPPGQDEISGFDGCQCQICNAYHRFGL